MVLRMSIVLPVVSVLTMLTVVVLIQKILRKFQVLASQLQGVVVFFSNNFKYLSVINGLVWRWPPGKGTVLANEGCRNRFIIEATLVEGLYNGLTSVAFIVFLNLFLS